MRTHETEKKSIYQRNYLDRQCSLDCHFYTILLNKIIEQTSELHKIVNVYKKRKARSACVHELQNHHTLPGGQS